MQIVHLYSKVKIVTNIVLRLSKLCKVFLYAKDQHQLYTVTIELDTLVMEKKHERNKRVPRVQDSSLSDLQCYPWCTPASPAPPHPTACRVRSVSGKKTWNGFR